MKPRNYEKRRKRTLEFVFYFSIMVVIMFTCGVYTLITAQEGITLLETKKKSYDKVFKKQAEITFQFDEIFKNLYSLKTKRRNLSEHKQMQKIISDARNTLELDLKNQEGDVDSYGLYLELLVDIEQIQRFMDYYEVEVDKRDYNMKQLEKCRKKYQELIHN